MSRGRIRKYAQLFLGWDIAEWRALAISVGLATGIMISLIAVSGDAQGGSGPAVKQVGNRLLSPTEAIPVADFGGCVDCDGCATSKGLDEYILQRHRIRAGSGSAGFRGGGPSVTAMGGLIVVEDDGSLTDDNGGSIWDLGDSTLDFVPTAGSPGSFEATRSSVGFDSDIGSEVATWEGVWGEHEVVLPFSFPFGTSSFSTLYVTSDFGVFFSSQPSNAFGFQYSQAGLTSSDPQITPLLRDSPWIWADILDLHVRTSVVITWHEQSSRPESNPDLDRMVQVVLNDQGMIRMSYPGIETFNTFGAVQVVAPGPGGSTLDDISVLGPVPTTVRFVRQAFTFPTLLVFSVQSVINSQFGFDDDSLDALAVYQNHYTEITSYAGAYHTNGRPGVAGIANDGPKRQSLLHMNHIGLSWNFRDDGSKVSVLSHEFGHRWLFFVNGVGSSRAGAHPAQNVHLTAAFPWLLVNDSSCMGGATWTDNLDGTFTSPPTRTYYGYSWVELYLMGLAPESQVPAWWYIDDNPALTAPYYPPVDTTYTGTRTMLEIGDVVSANGTRSPAYPASQDEFRVAIVLLTRPENPALGSDLVDMRSKMLLWPAAWEDSVGSRGSIDSELSEIVGTGDLDCNFNGVADADDLLTGSSADCNGNSVPDECESLPTITLTPQSSTVSPGGFLFYDVEIANDTPVVQVLDGWIDALRPDGEPYRGNPIGGPKAITLNPGRMVSRTVRLRIPAGTPAPSGPFTIRGSLGLFPDCVASSSSFVFSVVP